MINQEALHIWVGAILTLHEAIGNYQDKSASMAGPRWQSVLRAVKAFQAACISKGSQDRNQADKTTMG